MTQHEAQVQHDIVGVFADPTLALAVAQRVTALGVPSSAVEVADATARVESMKAEMRDETDNTFAGAGGVGPFTREMSKALVPSVLIGLCAGAILALPLGLIEWWSLELVKRLVIAACVGAATGATIGFELGGGFGARGGRDAMAAERGVPVSVRVADSLAADVVRIMREAQPLRLDVGSVEGNPVATLDADESTASPSWPRP